MVKKGDTLIEVLLAVGIFSMIAISVVAVMSGGTSSAQTALETTLAREEIDAQAEALRYIHDSYINDKNSNNTNVPTVALWRQIIKAAYIPTGNEDKDKEILQYTPTSCPTSASQLPTGAFILDTRNLSATPVSGESPAYISAKEDSTKSQDKRVFSQALTYPRLVFGTDSGSLIEGGSTSGFLKKAEGIYIVAVADKDTTTVFDVDGESKVTSPAFYDFYIRTCWYGTDAETPSTISTIIRLHNPDVKSNYQSFHFSINGGSPKKKNYLPFRNSDKTNVYNNKSIWPWGHTEGWSFDGWCLEENVVKMEDGSTACRGGAYQVGDVFYSSEGGNYNFVPVFSHIKYTIEYNSNGSQWQYNNGQPQICWEDVSQGKCVVQGDAITRSGYAFGGWCDGTVSSNGTCNGKTYQKDDIIYAPSGFPSSRIIKLTAIWRERNETITIKLTWNSSIDYDSYIYGTKSNNEPFTAYYSNKKPTETVSGVTRVLAELNHDCTGSCKDETFTINTLGGKDYYYYVRNYTNSNNITGATVVVSGPYSGTYTFYANNASGNGRIWNVFAYKDGKIVTPGPNGGTTRSSSANTKY